MPFDLQPFLKGPLLEMRPLRAEDFGTLYAVASDPLIWEQHPESNRYEQERFRVYFREALESGGALIATDTRNGAIIGASRFHGYDPEASEIEIGWTFLARPYWGGRYNGEMKRLMLEHAFRFVDHVVFLVGAENRRSRRALEKIGAVHIGNRIDGKGQDRVVYRITAKKAPKRVDLFDSTYTHFNDRVLEAVRRETFGEDFGQNSWVTLDEYERFIDWLELNPADHVLEVASGSGGPALFLARRAGCRVTGIDVNPSGVATATEMAARLDQAERVHFTLADATARLPFDDDSFDALLCVDSMNHLPDRLAVFREWNRVLRPGRRALFTDPVEITGPVTNDELALRSAVGLFLFVPAGTNERLIEEAGFRLIRREDVSENAASIAGRWRSARHAHREDLVRIEGEERFEGLQRFFQAVHRLTSERRLSRIAYVVETAGSTRPR